MGISNFEKRLQEFLKDKRFESIEEASKSLREFIDKENHTPLEEFCGISPYKMMKLLYFPFNTPDVVNFDVNVSPPLDAPFVRIFILLINGLHKTGGIKTTIKGNLPRDFCRELENAYLAKEDFKFLLREKFPIMKEEDSLELHRVRIITEMAGYIRKYKNRFILTKKGEKIIINGFRTDDYLHLVKTFTLQYNWAYYDLYGEVNIIQDSFLFTLYLLQNFGDEVRPKKFYADKFFTAFGDILKDTTPDLKYTLPPEEEIKNLYIHRAVDWFAIFLGFAETPEKSFHTSIFHKDVRKTNFLDRFIKFS